MTEHYLDRLAKAINENWDQPALTDFYLTEDGTAQDTSRGNHYTYGEMYAEILHLCELFQSLGLKQGDHIAICGANSAHWAIAYLATAAYQGVVVTILHSQSAEDIAHLIDFSDSKTLFTDADLWEELKDQSFPQVEHVINLDNWQILRGEEIQIINHKPKIINRDCHFSFGEPDDLAMICFTSGSTGKPKGVMLSYRNLSANVNYLYDELSLFKGNNVISAIPMAHIYGCFNDVLRPLCIGLSVNIIYIESGINDMLKCYQIIKPIFASLVPKFIEDITNKNVFPTLNDLFAYVMKIFGGNIQEFGIGGAGLSEKTEKILMGSRLYISKGYGMTECGPLISHSSTKYGIIKFKSVGKIVPTLQCYIAENGEILVKGENVMLGYYKDPEATARKIDADGWLHTGDKGHLDEDGYLYVEGRLEQDMIVLPNGENIHPEDIERKINALPEVSESIVLARDGKLVAIVVPQITNNQSPKTNTDLRRIVLRNVNPELPLYSQLYDAEITDVPLQRTEKQTIKRYLYK